MIRPLRDAGFVLGAALASGCYTYVPVQNPAPRTEVRLRLPVTGPAQGSRFVTRTVDIDGRVLAFGDTLILETTRRVQLSPLRELVGQDTLRVGADQIVSVEERVFSRAKTLALTALVVGALAAAVGGIVSASSGSGGGGPNSGPPPGADVSVGSIFRSLGGVLGR